MGKCSSRFEVKKNVIPLRNSKCATLSALYKFHYIGLKRKKVNQSRYRPGVLGEASRKIHREMKLRTWSGLHWAGPGQGQVADGCECGNEPSGSVKCGGIS